MSELTKEEVAALNDGVLDLMMAFALQPDKTKALRQLCQKQIDLEAQVAELRSALEYVLESAKCDWVQHDNFQWHIKAREAIAKAKEGK